MSTYWGFVCKSHIPAIESDQWFNHGERELLSLLERRPQIVGWGEDVMDRRYNDSNNNYGALMWLRAHPNCVVWLVNEYGDRLDPASLHCPTCICTTHPRGRKTPPALTRKGQSHPPNNSARRSQ